jgi:hypothetical protein
MRHTFPCTVALRYFGGMQLGSFVVWKKASGHINGTVVICVIIYENMRLVSIIYTVVVRFILNIPNWAKLRTRSWTPWKGEGVAGTLLRSRAVQLQGIKSNTTRDPCISWSRELQK